MEWEIIEPWEIGDRESIEMAKEFGGKKELSLVGVRRAEYGSRHGVTRHAMTGERMSDNIINKIHHYSGKIVLKSAIKIAKLIF